MIYLLFLRNVYTWLIAKQAFRNYTIFIYLYDLQHYNITYNGKLHKLKVNRTKL